jgi:hypothetical protein
MKQKNIVELKDRAGISDSLTELLRSGAEGVNLIWTVS